MGPPTKRLETQARACAGIVVDVLRHCLLDGRPADRVLAAILREHREYGARDRRLFSETVFAVLRWWGWLRPLAPTAFVDELKSGSSGEKAARQRGEPAPNGPVTRSQEWARVLLGAHVLESLELPDAVDVWARQAKVRLPRGMRPQDTDDLAARRQRLERTFGKESAPRLRASDLVPSWTGDELPKGRTLHELLPWLQRRPPVWLRSQSTEPAALAKWLCRDGLEARCHEAVPGALSIGHPRVNLRTLDAFKRGAFEVQDLASQMVGLICAPQAGERWWDACAGAGGKALHLGSLMQGKGTVVATDKRTYKLDDLRRRARRAGLSNIRCRAWTGARPAGRRTQFHGVLVDAPCSCSGTWRRNPDGRWTCTQAEIAELAELQLHLLSSAASGVRPDGVLVYATCSMFRRENQAVVDAFLHEHPEFGLSPFMNPLTGDECSGVTEIWPWDGDCDAMFVARLVQNRR